MKPAITLLIFSPTGSTKRIVTRIGNLLSDRVLQLNLMEKNIEKRIFTEEDLVVVGVPVYGGRIPVLAAEAIRKFRGSNTPVVSVVVYGNRAFDDALLELNDLLQENSFRILASGAFVAQHSIANEIAKSRPDAEDYDEIEQFVQSVLKKYEKSPSDLWETISVDGARPYKEHKSSGVVPVVTDQCVQCKACVNECPVGAITSEGTNPEKCFLCMRCVAICPQKARILPPEYKTRIFDYLKQACPERNSNVIYI